MKPVRTPTMEDTMHGPEGSGIEPLPCRIGDGFTASVWELTDEEREQVAEGAHIGLFVMADPTPPVMLAVSPPPGMTWSEELRTFVRPEPEEDMQ